MFQHSEINSGFTKFDNSNTSVTSLEFSKKKKL